MQNLGAGYVALLREAPSPPVRWQGSARVLLDRLRELPDGAGSDAVVRALSAA